MATYFRPIAVSIVLVLSTAMSGPPRQGASQQASNVSPQPAPGQSRTQLPDGRWLLLGGEGRPAAASIWNPESGAVERLPTFGTGRAWHTATVLPDGSVLVLGGVDPQGQVVASPERFDPLTGHFAAIDAASVSARARHTATLLTDGRVLLLGGDVAGGGLGAELWDPSRDAAFPVGVAPIDERRGHTARLLPDGRVLIAGGTDPGGQSVSGTEMFEPGSDIFVTAVDVPSAAQGLAGSHPADGAVDLPSDTRVVLRFGDSLDVTSIRAGSIQLEGPAGAVAASVVPAESGRLVFVTPATALAPETRFSLRATGLRRATGQPIPAATVRFTTAAEERIEPPAVAHDPEVWTPAHGWRTGGADRLSRQLPPLKAADGITALAGQVLRLDGTPLADVTLEMEGRTVRSDRTGRFLLKLGTLPSGWCELLIDGRTANRAGRRFGVFEFGLTIVKGRTNVLPFTIWMPVLDTANAVRIDSPTRRETVITTPHIPGLELHLPAGTVITDEDGKTVREISITPIPIDRPPFPLPTGVEVPVYFTIQPGGAYVSAQTYGQRKGAWLVYPNYAGKPPGEPANFWHYDPEERGWYVYGLGRVAADGRQVVPNAGVSLYEFTGAMFNYGQSPGSPGGNGPSDGDPVDLGTGQFVLDKTDLALPDVIPLVLTRTYRTGDNGQRPFGIGATHPYAMFLWSANQYTEVDLILPNGKRIHYVRTSSGTGFEDAAFAHTASPTPFHSSTVVWNGNGWDLTLKDGTVYVFGNEAPLQSMRDRFGNTVTLTWSTIGTFGNGTGNLLKVTSPNGRWIEFTYDTSNRITQAKDNANRTVGYEYDSAGRVWKVTDAKGGVTEYTYDAAHRMLTIKDPRNIVYLENEYDTAGRVILQTQADGGEYEFDYTVNGSGQITQTDVTNPRGYVRRVTFNSEGFATSDIAALGDADEQGLTYDRLTGSQLIEQVTDELNRVTRFEYDTKGNVSRVTRLYGTADANPTEFTYDPTFNLLATVTDPLNHTTTTAYDTVGRAVSLTNALNQQTTFGHNAAGQLVSTTNPLSEQTTLGYVLSDLTSVQTPLGHTRTQFVDAAGRVIQSADALGRVTRFEYDALNQVTKMTDPIGGETTFTYDGNGNLLTLTDARGKTTTWTYDSMDRVATRTDPLTRQESFTYDLNGNLKTWTDRKGQVTSYQYDALDRLTFVGFGTTGNPPTYASTMTTTYDDGNRITEVVDSVAGTIERTYDLLDRLTQEDTPEGTIDYVYDAAGRRTSMTVAGQTAVSYTYDNADRLTAVTQGTATVSIGYDAASRRTTLTLPNGILVEYAYDDDSQLAGLTYKLSGNTIGTLTYAYDTNGQRVAVGGSYARTGLPAALTSATYDNANQIATFGGTTHSYDAKGNLTSDGSRTYSWNTRNELTGITGPVNANFSYDAFGRRRAKTVSGTTTEFLYDGLNPVQELAAGTPTANVLTGLGIDEYFRRTDATTTRHYLTDALGSPIGLADGSGTVQTEYTYEPFGSSSTSGASTTSATGFTGREADGTGVLFYRARYYDPRLRQFISEDPIGFDSGDFNLHGYVSNDPINLTDPTGEFALAGCILGAGIAIAPDIPDLLAGRGCIPWLRVGIGCLAGGFGLPPALRRLGLPAPRPGPFPYFPRIRPDWHGPHHYFPKHGARLPHIQITTYLNRIPGTTRIGRIPLPRRWTPPSWWPK